MKQRPNPFFHMMAWGLSSGTILATSFIIVLADFASGFAGGAEIISVLLSPSLWQVAFMFGGIPGAILGFFCGLTLWGILRKAPIPFTEVDMADKKWGVYGSIFMLTLLLGALMASPLMFVLGVFMLLPPLIAALAATYAAHRYMFRLRLWSGGIEGRKSKAKAKHEAYHRLADDARQDYSDYEEHIAEKQDTLIR